MKILHRAGFYFISVWNKSIKGRTLIDIKAYDNMIPFFATHVTELITDTIGDNLRNGTWAIVATPKRRHLTHNFASLIAEEIGKRLGIPFYDDYAHAQTRERVNVVFTANNIPKEQNIIVFDDFVPSGSTIGAMKNLLDSLGKTSVYFIGINATLTGTARSVSRACSDEAPVLSNSSRPDKSAKSVMSASSKSTEWKFFVKFKKLYYLYKSNIKNHIKMKKIHFKFATLILYIVAILTMQSCSEEKYTVWTDTAYYSDFVSQTNTTITDGYYIKIEIAKETWEEMAKSLTSEGRHKWDEATIKKWFISYGFGESEARKESSWLTIIDHGMVIKRTDNMVNLIVK